MLSDEGAEVTTAVEVVVGCGAGTVGTSRAATSGRVVEVCRVVLLVVGAGATNAEVVSLNTPGRAAAGSVAVSPGV